MEAEREGLESQLAAVGAEREARAETERDLEEALEQLQTAEELTSLQAELEALRGGESARSQAPPSAGAWPRCRRCGWHPVSDPELPGAAPTPTTHCSFCRAMPAGCTHCGQWGMREVGGEAETIPAETIPADKDVLALVIRVTEAPALNCWSCSMYEWMKLQGSRVHPHVL